MMTNTKYEPLIPYEAAAPEDPEPQGAPKNTANVLSGIGFHLGQQRLVLPLSETREIYIYAKHPRPSPVPEAPHWLKGVTSLRGQLLPIVDLGAFLCDATTAITRQNRVLVIKHPSVLAGLLVDDVTGLKRFKADERVRKGPPFAGHTPRFLQSVFRQGDEYWGVLSVAKLARDKTFFDAAA